MSTRLRFSSVRGVGTFVGNSVAGLPGVGVGSFNGFVGFVTILLGVDDLLKVSRPPRSRGLTLLLYGLCFCLLSDKVDRLGGLNRPTVRR